MNDMKGRNLNQYVILFLAVFTFSCTQRNNSKVVGEFSGSESFIDFYEDF